MNYLCQHCSTPIRWDNNTRTWEHSEEAPENSACWEGTKGPEPHRTCKRPRCNTQEFRINGYCSVYCAKMHELEEENQRLQTLLDQQERAKMSDHAVRIRQTDIFEKTVLVSAPDASQAVTMAENAYADQDLATHSNTLERTDKEFNSFPILCLWCSKEIHRHGDSWATTPLHPEQGPGLHCKEAPRDYLNHRPAAKPLQDDACPDDPDGLHHIGCGCP